MSLEYKPGKGHTNELPKAQSVLALLVPALFLKPVKTVLQRIALPHNPPSSILHPRSSILGPQASDVLESIGCGNI